MADVTVDGGACDAALGPACLTPARCVTTGGGSAGTCVKPTRIDLRRDGDPAHPVGPNATHIK
jgi:hypothetical protein